MQTIGLILIALALVLAAALERSASIIKSQRFTDEELRRILASLTAKR